MGGDHAETWDAEILPAASRQLRDLPNPERQEALDILIDLAENPFLPGAEQLRGYNNPYKIRFGRGERYRVLYDVFPASRRVLIGAIKLRGPDTYSGMDKWRS